MRVFPFVNVTVVGWSRVVVCVSSSSDGTIVIVTPVSKMGLHVLTVVIVFCVNILTLIRKIGTVSLCPTFPHQKHHLISGSVHVKVLRSFDWPL